ncbi:MAG: T9SS type A sorting domain-containing protein [Bacteroidota bacterium]|nr:T9SS type A sorting domain-containing protein [Bacteroidota bacterium]
MKKLYSIFLMVSIMLISSFTVVSHNELPLDQTRTVQFYPNPATSVIYFEFPSNFEKASYSLHIYNFLGKKMNELQVNSSKLSVQLDNYLRGLYIFQIRDKTGAIIESGKFQVVK